MIKDIWCSTYVRFLQIKRKNHSQRFILDMLTWIETIKTHLVRMISVIFLTNGCVLTNLLQAFSSVLSPRGLQNMYRKGKKCLYIWAYIHIQDTFKFVSSWVFYSLATVRFIEQNLILFSSYSSDANYLS